MNPQQSITDLLDNYFRGLFTGDVELLRSVFHPQAALFGEVRGAPYQSSVEGWLSVVAKRNSPRDLGETMRMEILGIEQVNDVAYARARCPMLGFNYVDYLALVRSGERWLIANKLFTHVNAGG